LSLLVLFPQQGRPTDLHVLLKFICLDGRAIDLSRQNRTEAEELVAEIAELAVDLDELPDLRRHGQRMMYALPWTTRVCHHTILQQQQQQQQQQQRQQSS